MEAETTVSDRGAVTVPSEIRERLDIQPGDKIRWEIDDEGKVQITVVKQRYGAFDGFDPVDIGETDAVSELTRLDSAENPFS